MATQKTKSTRLDVQKTYKLYIGGAFPRTESGRYLTATNKKGDFVANYCRASRKDFRNAVVAARHAQGGWGSRTAFNRGQILYRMAEMLESRRASFEASLVTLAGYSAAAAETEVSAAVDRLVWYAGWADKFIQLFSTTNPVASPHFNFTMSEPTGVVAVLAPQNAPLLGLISALAPVIVVGNAAV
nr:aldehyde dehydrogenase family protein [Lujinxingiaceae bacterium]